MNDSGQWADASGNTYNVEHPLDEVTVKYFNTVYDDLVDKYINKDLYPGFGDVKPKFKM